MIYNVVLVSFGKCPLLLTATEPLLGAPVEAASCWGRSPKRAACSPGQGAGGTGPRPTQPASLFAGAEGCGGGAHPGLWKLKGSRFITGIGPLHLRSLYLLQSSSHPSARSSQTRQAVPSGPTECSSCHTPPVGCHSRASQDMSSRQGEGDARALTQAQAPFLRPRHPFSG